MDAEPRRPPKSLDLRRASLQNPVMKASSAAAAALSALIGADTDPRTLPFDEANRLLERIANTPDESLLDALYCRFDRDQRMIPSTPAWIWFKEGELALVGN